MKSKFPEPDLYIVDFLSKIPHKFKDIYISFTWLKLKTFILIFWRILLVSGKVFKTQSNEKDGGLGESSTAPMTFTCAYTNVSPATNLKAAIHPVI